MEGGPSGGGAEFSDLPADVLQVIGAFLNAPSLVALAQVNHRAHGRLAPRARAAANQQAQNAWPARLGPTDAHVLRQHVVNYLTSQEGQRIMAVLRRIGERGERDFGRGTVNFHLREIDAAIAALPANAHADVREFLAAVRSRVAALWREA